MKIDKSRILITGGTGSWGHELVTQLLDKYPGVEEIRIYSRGEHKQVAMKREFNYSSKLKFIIGDVRDKNILNYAMRGIDIVFHLAALKHVPVCEENTWEAVLTNINGTQNVIEAAINNKVKKVIDVSTDKAVDPFNLYGVTKACGEKLVINSNFNYSYGHREDIPSFICIRGGNVIGTNGSVIPLFKEQLLKNNEITVTNPKMTRYLMSTKEAISLIFTAVENSKGGELFVMNMPGTTVEVIANVMIKLFGNSKSKIKIIGERPGEKRHEVLVSKNESSSTYILSDKYYVVLPQIDNLKLNELYKSNKKFGMEEFTSANTYQLSEKEMEEILKKEKMVMGVVAVTGANGFVGKRLVHELLLSGHKVRTLIHENSSIKENKVASIVGDLNTGLGLSEFLSDANILVHLAGKSTPPEDNMFMTNVNGTFNLVNNIRSSSIKHIIYLSTIAVYGENKNDNYSESSICSPVTSYGLSKYLAEIILSNWSLKKNIPVTILRPFNIYGPGNYKGVIYEFYKSTIKENKVAIFGDGKQKRDFLFIDDAVSAIMKAIPARYNGIINIGSGQVMTLLDVISNIELILDRKVKVDFYDSDIEKITEIKYDLHKAREILDWSAKMNFRNGIKETYNSYK